MGDLADYTLIGESPGDMFGYSVASAGLFNNDALLDVLIGAPKANSNGSLYVFFGGPTQPPFIPAGQNDFYWIGENSDDNLGWSVDCAGNVDNDTAGYQEVIVGAPLNDSGGNMDSGSVYVLHMFNQPELMIGGQGSNIYQSTPQGVQVNLSAIEAGTNGTWFLIVENDGSLNDSFIFNFTYDLLPGWSFNVEELFSGLPINNGDIIYWPTGIFVNYKLTISAPIGAVDGDEVWVDIKIISQNDTTKVDVVRAIARVFDVTPPEIGDETTGTPTTGDPFLITANITDNILLDEAYLYFWFDTTEGLTVPLNVTMVDLGGGDFEYEIIVPSNALEFFYNISAKDTSGNWNETYENSLAVEDNDAPMISDVISVPQSQIIGGNVNITVNITDGLAVESVKINISFPDGSWILEDMNQYDDDGWYHEDLYHDVGIYNYTILTNDSSGNENESQVYQFNVIAPPPTVDYIQIRSESNNEGVVITNIVYDLGDIDTFYAAGYNFSSGYIEDVEVGWSSTDESGVILPDYGSSTNFTGGAVGEGTIFAVYDLGIQNSTDFEVILSNIPEIIGTIPDIVIVEDYPLVFQTDMEIYADHIEGTDELYWILEGVDESIITIIPGFENEKGKHIFSFATIDDMHGNMEATYWLLFDDINKTSQKAWINITPVNDAPRIGDCPDLVLRFDLPYSFDYAPYISDIDNALSELTLSVEDTDSEVKGFVVTYNYPESMLGMEEFVTLRVSDGELEWSTVIKVTIASNIPPEIVSQLPDITLFEKEISLNHFDLDNNFIDKDGDKLIYSIVGESNINITIDDNNFVNLSADTGWSGTEFITIRATDIFGAIAEQTIELRVIPVNDPPEIDPIDEIRIHYDYNYTFDLGWYLSDQDNDIEDLVISTSNPDNVTVNGTKLTFLYPKVWENQDIPYTVHLLVYVSDGFFNVSSTITVNVSGNFPPDILRPLNDLFMFEDTSYVGAFDLDEFFYDLDGDPIFYTYGNESISVVINEDHTVDFTPHPNWYGSERIIIRASDDKGAFLEDIIVVTVIPENDPPLISEIPDQSGEQETEWILDLTEYLSDIDNDLQDLSISVNSSYVEIRGHVLVFYYPSNITKDIIWITVNDGEDNRTIPVRITVTEPTVPTPEVPWILIMATVVLAVLLLAALITRIARYKLEELFLITKSGMLIVHKGVHVDEEKDKDILASMFVAVQSFIKDAFAEEDTEVLKRMDYGEKTVLIHMGNYVLLTAFITGQESKAFLKNMEEFIDHIEKRFVGAIEQWDGNYDNLPEIDELLVSFFDGTFKKEFLKPFTNNVTGDAPKEKGDAEA
jgi:hypothetical protein